MKPTPPPHRQKPQNPNQITTQGRPQFHPHPQTPTDHPTESRCKTSTASPTSPRLYAVISFPVVAASLVIMLSLVLRVVEEVAPNLADNPTTRHIIYVCIGVVIALVAWFKRQSTMARVCPPTPDGGIEDNPTAYQTPAPPNDGFQQIDDTTIPQPH